MKRRNLLFTSGLMIGGLLSSLTTRGKAASQEIRRITPPNLTDAHLGKRILCHRPMRRGSPNMSADLSGDRILVHNYGHGGSGWTLAPGAASYVVGLMEERLQNRAPRQKEPIAIVGAGVIGLFTAFELVRRGYKKITIIAEKFEETTSHNAAGLLAPVSMDNSPSMQALIDKIGVDAYKFYRSVAEGRQEGIKKGAKVIPAYFETRRDSGLEPYVGVVMGPAKDVILDFGNGTRRSMVAYDDSIFMDTAALMHELRSFLEPFVTFEKRRVLRLDDLKEKLVFDCAGMGSAALNNDANMVSVQGHLVMLKDQRPQDMRYQALVYFDDKKTETGQKVKRSFYVMPKHLPGSAANDIGVIGGTFIEQATEATPNDAEFNLLIDGARKFYGI